MISAPINRVKCFAPWMSSTGDDDGIVKLWDPRSAGEIRSYLHHSDFISDFLWFEDKKQLVSTRCVRFYFTSSTFSMSCHSGDGTLSVIDVRSKSTEPFAHSEDQEDELLSIISMQGSFVSLFVIETSLNSLCHKWYQGCRRNTTWHIVSIQSK